MKILLAAAALAVALAAPISATAADHGAGAAFHVRAAYSVALGQAAGCDGFQVTGTGGATGTQLGAGTWNDVECAVFTDAITITGRLTLTAANGDELFVDYTASSPLPTPAVHPSGTFEIVGGTGRFSDATGGGTISATGSVVDPATTATLDGVIDLHS